MDQEHPKVDLGGSMGSQIHLLDRAHIEFPDVLLLYLRFYTQNIYQLKKNIIKIEANLVQYADACKAIKLVANNWYNVNIDIIDNSNDKSNNHYAKDDFVEFKIYTKILLANIIRKTYNR